MRSYKQNLLIKGIELFAILQTYKAVKKKTMAIYIYILTNKLHGILQVCPHYFGRYCRAFIFFVQQPFEFRNIKKTLVV